LHPAARTATPPPHDAARHIVSSFTKPAHVERSTPSQLAALHTFPPTAPRHGGRPARGAPETAMHIPDFPGSLHASHGPVHAPSQQTPSAQKPEAQSEALVHVFARMGLQTPVPSHAFMPAQVSGSGAPVTAAQTPGLAGRLHAWHFPHAALSQQVASTQWPVSQSASFAHAPARKWRSHVSP
jgi:hypothetical protein